MDELHRNKFPFKIIPCSDEENKKFEGKAEGLFDGLAKVNHWGFKESGHVTEEIMSLFYNQPIRNGDIWIVTPPKSGTTWGQEMIWLIANDLDYEAAKKPLMPVRWKFLDIGGLIHPKHVENLAQKVTAANMIPLAGMIRKFHALPDGIHQRFIKSHLPMSLNPPDLLDVAKVIYLARNPKDVLVSYYNHMKVMAPQLFHGDLDEFFELYIQDLLGLTPVIPHVIEGWNLRHHPNMCFIFYEDMKKDLPEVIRKVSTFLGKSYTEDQIGKLCDHLSIENMKKNPFLMDLPHEVLKGGSSGFFRKGKAGDWKNHLSAEQNARLDAYIAKHLKGTDLTFIEDLKHQS